MDVPLPIRPASSAPAHRVQVRGVTLRRGARKLVDSLELDIEPGQRWALLGPNGAGKTTLLLALAGALPPASGQISYDGRPLAHWSIAALAGRRAFVPDRWHDPFAARVLEVVQGSRYRLRHDPAGARVAREALEDLDCGALPDRDVRRLSRGERQRVAIATGLAQGAPLVLLDEPTAHQDPRHQAFVLARLAARPAQTWVASLHDVNAAARFATHALLLWGDGRWRAGPAADTLTAEALGALFGVTVHPLVGPDGRAVFAMGAVA